MKRALRLAVVCGSALCLMGFLLPQCGGLNARDFRQVNVSGFDAVDNAVDKNDYAYSMEYFQPGGADAGHLYVGTCNNMGGLIGFYIEVLRSGGDILQAPARPPEIRRYRPDLGPTVWETVLDYRDVETSPTYRTIGFRFMTVLDAAAPDKAGATAPYLYAATQGEQTVLWRSQTGNRGEWERVFTFDTLGASIRWIAQLDGRIYLAIAYDSFGAAPPPGEIWISDDGLSFRPLLQDGFGDPNNRGVQALIAYQGWIYAGTKNDVDGFQIWKLRPRTPGSDDYDFVRVVDGGGPSTHNENAGMPIVFGGKLYFGTQLYIAGINPTSGHAFEGCDIIRINEDDSWQTIVGPDSLSGYESGFNQFSNSYLWWMEEYDGWLYAGTFDQGTLLSSVLNDIDGVLAFLQMPVGQGVLGLVTDLLDSLFSLDDYRRLTRAGGDIFKSPDGVAWYPVTRNGLGDPTNYGWRTMKACPDGYLYIGSANTTTGTQIWRARTPIYRERE